MFPYLRYRDYRSQVAAIGFSFVANNTKQRSGFKISADGRQIFFLNSPLCKLVSLYTLVAQGASSPPLFTACSVADVSALKTLDMKDVHHSLS